MPIVEVTRTYLELQLDAPAPVLPKPPSPVTVERMQRWVPELYRRLYAEVGAEYHWRDRAGWDDERLRAHLAKPGVSVWLLRIGGELAGYFELNRDDEGGVEIAYFGLLPAFVGRGFGGACLAEAVRAARTLSPTRIWLHTCTLDHPAALPNYLRHGFRPFKTESYQVER